MAAARKSGFPRGVALLRGINVGKAKRIAMADLRALFVELGFTDPRSLLNSGNIVFGSPAHTVQAAAALIEEAVAARTGVHSRVTVIDASTLAAIVADNPMADSSDDHARLIAFTLAGAREAALLAPLAAQDWGDDRLHIGRHAAYVACPGRVLDSKLAAAVGKVLGEATTARNWNTILKLHALCSEPAPAAS